MGPALRVILLVLLAGCGGQSHQSDFCLLAAPLRPNGAAWDVADQVFKQQIVLHNGIGMQVCGWEP